MQPEKKVDRKHISSLNERTFSGQYRCRKPLLIEGFLDEQSGERKLVSLWSDEFLCSKLKDPNTGAPRQIEAFKSRDNMHFVDQADIVERVQLTIDDLLRILSVPAQATPSFPSFPPPGDVSVAPASVICASRLYYRDLLFPELQMMVPHPTQLLYETAAGLKGFSRPLQMSWIGVKGCVTSLHYDRCHGFLVQIRGKKRVHLFDPKHTPSLYPHSSVSTKGHLARVSLTDLRDPLRREEALRRFPLLAKAQPKVTDLIAGEVLYIPPGHWHEVETLENSISVTIPWDLRPEEQPPRHMYS